jgi:hypothetical protein
MLQFLAMKQLSTHLKKTALPHFHETVLCHRG